MSDKKSLSVRPASMSSTEVLKALGPVFARCYAAFAVEVMKLMREQGLWRPEDGEHGPMDPAAAEAVDPAILEQAPEWIKAAFERQDAGADVQEPGPHEDDVRANVARNTLVMALRRQGMTQADLAERLGKSPAAISRVLKNPHRSRIRTLKAIADALEVDLSEVL